MSFFAGGFLYNPDTQSVLLHKRDRKAAVNPRQWAFFGGTSEEGETPEATFIREMHEELGVLLRSGELVPLVDYWNQDRQTHRHIFYSESRIPKEELTLQEGEALDWVRLDEVFSYDLTEKTIRDLRTFIVKISYKKFDCE